MKRHGWIRRFVSDFNSNHAFQIKFHFWMMRFWELNFIAGWTLMLMAPAFWNRIGVFYVFVLSIYANWDTDDDAMTAAQAALHAEKAAENTENKSN